MNILHKLHDKVAPPPYRREDDPLIQERQDIAEQTRQLVFRLENEAHPRTGMTLADMAANRHVRT